MAITLAGNLITLTGDGANPAGGTSWGNAYDMEDVLTACGAVVTKQGANAYDISARLKFESGVYFVSKSEFVELKPNPINPVYTIRAEAGSHIRFGEYNAVDGYSYNGAFWQIYLQSTTGSQSSTGNRIMGEFLVYGSNIICDSTSYQRGPHFVAGATIRLCNSILKWAGYFWAANCNMQDIKFHGGGGTYDMLFATGYDYSFSGVTSINCNYGLFFSSTTDAPVDVYNQKFQGCTYDIGLISTGHLIRVINSPFTTYYAVGSGKSFKECYEFNVKVTDDQGSPIVGATVQLKDVDGTEVFSEDTVAGGVLAADKVVVRKWFRHANQGGNKDYNDHTLKVTSGSDETEYKITIDHQIKEDVVLLPQSVASYDNIMAGINDMKGTGFVKDTDSLVDIRPETGKIQSVKDKTNNLPASPAPANEYDTQLDANMTSRAPAAEYDTEMARITADVATEAKQDTTDGKVDTIQAKTDNLKDSWNDPTAEECKATGFATQNPPSQSLEDYKANVSALALEVSVQSVKDKTDTIDWSDIDFIKQVEQGRWKIANNQMIFYDADGVTPLRTFDLKDKQGQSTEIDPFERVPV